MIDVSSYIDHTILKPVTLLHDVKRLCDEAASYKFAAVCVPPPFVRNASVMLRGTGVKVATVIGFPFGYSVAAAKLAEVSQAIKDGADEFDVVINLTAVKAASWTYLESEFRLLFAPIREKGIIKVIIESGILTDEEILMCCKIYGDGGAHFLKTSTGYAEKGASLHAVQLMRSNLPSGIKIKASGGIKTYHSAVEYINAGADRIGCSAGVSIMQQQAEL